MIPKWFLRSKFWFVNLFMDEYMTRDAMAIMMATFVLHVPMYFWGILVNREIEIYNSHIIYQVDYAPRRNRLTHSLIFEEFETQVEKWRSLQASTQ